MSDCLWNDIDNYLVAALLADMGPASDYATANPSDPLLLSAANIEVGDYFEPQQVKTPFVLVCGVEADWGTEEGPHGDGEMHYDGLTYPYALLFVVKGGSVAGVKASAAELVRRGREMLRSRIAFGELQSDDGETVVDVQPGPVQLQLSSYGEQPCVRVALGVLTFKVLTEI